MSTSPAEQGQTPLADRRRAYENSVRALGERRRPQPIEEPVSLARFPSMPIDELLTETTSIGVPSTTDPGHPDTTDHVGVPKTSSIRRRVRSLDLWLGVLFVLVSAAVYDFSNPHRWNFYNHFVWYAQSLLSGSTTIPFPVPQTSTSFGNAYFQDVMAVLDAAGQVTGRGILPFPPLPAFFLAPFVAIWGLATDAETIAALTGAVVVGLVYWMLGGLSIRRSARIGATIVFAFGSVFWYTAALGTTWFFAHIIGTGLAVIAVGIVLRTRTETIDVIREDIARPYRAIYILRHQIGSFFVDLSERPRRFLHMIDPRDLFHPDISLVVAAFFIGMAVLARAPIVFGLAFVLIAGGGHFARRPISIALGAAIPLAMLFLFTHITTGAFVNPAYDYLYQREAYGYPDFGYVPAWAIEDLRYIPQNLGIMFGHLPVLFPTCDPGYTTRSFTDAHCLWAKPDWFGTSILLMTPAYLLIGVAVIRVPRSLIVWGGLVSTVAIGTFDLMHFSQGWVQIGYRFSNDFIPFALPVIAIGLDRMRGRSLTLVAWGLVVFSVVMNAWAVVTRVALGW